MTVEYKNPIPSRASKRKIWDFAETQRHRAGISNGFDLSKLVVKNGGTIEYIGIFDKDQTDAIVVEPSGAFTIHISSETGVLRDNFTIAHELGHLLLHWPKVRKAHPECGMRATRRIDESQEPLVRCEWEANWFASAFLMPKGEFEEAFRQGVASQIFGVTQAAVDVRAKALCLDS